MGVEHGRLRTPIWRAGRHLRTATERKRKAGGKEPEIAPGRRCVRVRSVTQPSHGRGHAPVRRAHNQKPLDQPDPGRCRRRQRTDHPQLVQRHHAASRSHLAGARAIRERPGKAPTPGAPSGIPSCNRRLRTALTAGRRGGADQRPAPLPRPRYRNGGPHRRADRGQGRHHRRPRPRGASARPPSPDRSSRATPSRPGSEHAAGS